MAQTAPLPSNIMQHPELAATFEAVATHGRDGYYKGRIAQGERSSALDADDLIQLSTAIVDLIKDGGGVMSLEDLAECDAEVIEPIHYDYKVGPSGKDGVTLWEVSLLDLICLLACS